MADTVIDSSVWIDFFNRKTNIQIEIVKKIILAQTVKSTITILPIILQEVLQGIENKRFYEIVKENLAGFNFLNFDAYKIAVDAADLYRFLQKKGVTIRKANDCLIAAVCIEHEFSLLHNDKDFTNIAKYTSLKIYK